MLGRLDIAANLTAPGGIRSASPSASNSNSASSDSALDTELADTTKWIVQTVHKEFQTTLELGAFSQWLQSKREFAEAKAMEEAAYDELSDRFDNIYSTMNNYLPPAVWASGSWWR